MEHSTIFGGSIAARRIHCPGSYALEKEIPKGEASEHAERGTALHEAMEHYLLDCEGQPMSCLLDMTFNGWEITQELVDEKLQPAFDAFQVIIAMAGGGLDYMIEVKVSLDEVIPGAFGTVDVLGVGKDGKLYVIDWKFGDGVPVNVKNNYQMAFYTAGALYDKDPDIVDLVGDDSKHWDIVFCVVQPRAGYRDEPNWQHWETDDAWIEDFIDIAVAAYDKMQQPDAPLALGDHCRFCSAKAVSCALQQDAVKVATSDAADALIDTMDPVSISSWLDREAQVVEFFKDLKKHAHAEAERGVKIPGWKLVPKRGSRAYTDTAAAEKGIRKKLKVVDAFKRELISPAQAEKKMGKKEYERLVAPHVTMVSSGTTLARDTDNRPDVSDPSQSLAKKMQATLGLDAPANES